MRDNSNSQEEEKQRSSSEEININPCKFTYNLFIDNLGSNNSHSPEVTKVLMKWLKHHVMYPYPSEEERIALCQRTGLTRKQLRSWFTDARRVIPLRLSNPHLAEIDPVEGKNEHREQERHEVSNERS